MDIVYYINYVKDKLIMTDYMYLQRLHDDKWFCDGIEDLKYEYYTNGETDALYDILLRLITVESGINKSYVDMNELIYQSK